MAGNLAWIGVDIRTQDELREIVESAMPHAALIGRIGQLETHRWQDPSGARLVVVTRRGAIEQLLPSYAGLPGAWLRGVRALNDEVSQATVVHESGEQLTMLALEIEQRALIRRQTVCGHASLVALGSEVTAYRDSEAFAASLASLVGPPDEDPGEPPPHVVQFGLAWPPRWGAESFVSYGVFGEPAAAEAYARLNGVVRHAERRTNRLTGQEFIVARVTSVGFEADVCLAASEHPEVPAAGAVVAGTVFMVGSLETWAVDEDDEKERRPATGWRERISRAFGRRRH